MAIIAVLMILSLCLLLAACDTRETEPPDEQSEVPGSSTQAAADDIADWSEYRIICTPGNGAADAERLKAAIRESCGVSLRVMTDSEGESGREILIGATNRAASSAALGGLNGYTFTAARSGEAIILVGTNDYLTGEAVSYFIGHCIEGGDRLEAPYTSAAATPLKLTDNANAAARIVYGGESALEAAKSIHAKIKELTGIDIGIFTGVSARDNGGFEILIGDAGRGQSDEALAGLTLGEYAVGVYGGKLVLNAWQSDALPAAAAELCGVLGRLHTSGGDLAVLDGMRLTGEYNKSLGLLPATEKISEIYYNGDQSYTVIMKNVSETEYKSYNESLRGQGLELYTENEINKNLFVTYTDGESVVNSIFIRCDSQMRLISEPLSVTALPALEAKLPAADVTVAPLVTQIGLEVSGEKEDYQNGMSYVIRTKDGSFIVIDGGHSRAANAANLFKVLRTQAPDAENIVIAAWIFTHAHTDHAGTFRHFAPYGKYLTVESFIFNFPDENSAAENATMVEYITGIKREIAGNFPDAVIYKAHAGQVYHIRDAELEILYSTELLTPEDIMVNFNWTSLIFSMELAGKKLMFMGDCTVESTALVCRMYGATLKSDFVQVGHHGSSGGSTELYSSIDPVYVLWPLGEYKYENGYRDSSRNAFFRASTNIRQICVAGDNIWVVDLSASRPDFTKYDTINLYR